MFINKKSELYFTRRRNRRSQNQYLASSKIRDVLQKQPNIIHENLIVKLFEKFSKSIDAKYILKTISDATDGDFYIVGGSIRHVIMNSYFRSDIDIIINNNDTRVFDLLDKMSVPYSLNSHNHRRYKWNKMEVDIFQPKDFYSGFNDVTSVLKYFDLKINAIGVHVGTKKIIDPFNICALSKILDPGINWERWDKMDSDNICVLALRLMKIMIEIPELKISELDCQKISLNVLPKIKEVDWNKINNRFPLGKDLFISEFLNIIYR